MIRINTLRAKIFKISSPPPLVNESLYFDDLVKALESCSQDEFDSSTLEYVGSNSIIPAVGSTINIPYMYVADDPSSAVNIPWKVLGYNASIPEYVKYKSNDGECIYLKSLKNDGLLKTDDDWYASEVYSKTFNESTLENEYTYIGIITYCGDRSFEYGNSNKFCVPNFICIEDKEYTCCGYNVTLQTEYLLNVDDHGVSTYTDYLTLPWFKSDFTDEFLKNIWSESNIRKWLNQKDYISMAKSYNTQIGGGLNFNCKSFMNRVLNSENFLKCVINCVSKTWVYNNFQSTKTVDSNGCEHVSDRFWLLDSGNVNNIQFNQDPDYNYSTSRFSNIYVNSNMRKKFGMFSDRSITSTVGCWWLRSAYDYDYDYVCKINEDGNTSGSHVVSDFIGISPACVIG